MWLVQIFARYLCLNFLVSLFQFSPPLEQCQVLLDLSNILNNVLNNIFSKSWTTSWAFFVGLEYDYCLALLRTHPILLRHWYFGQIIEVTSSTCSIWFIVSVIIWANALFLFGIETEPMANRIEHLISKYAKMIVFRLFFHQIFAKITRRVPFLMSF